MPIWLRFPLGHEKHIFSSSFLTLSYIFCGTFLLFFTFFSYSFWHFLATLCFSFTSWHFYALLATSMNFLHLWHFFPLCFNTFGYFFAPSGTFLPAFSGKRLDFYTNFFYTFLSLIFLWLFGTFWHFAIFWHFLACNAMQCKKGQR